MLYTRYVQGKGGGGNPVPPQDWDLISLAGNIQAIQISPERRVGAIMGKRVDAYAMSVLYAATSASKPGRTSSDTGEFFEITCFVFFLGVN